MYTIEKKTLTDIADAIREKTGKSELILPEDMPGEIAGIENQTSSQSNIRGFELYAADFDGNTRNEHGVLDNSYFTCFFHDNMSNSFTLNNTVKTFSIAQPGNGVGLIYASTLPVINLPSIYTNAIVSRRGSRFSVQHNDNGSYISVVGGWVGYPSNGAIYEQEINGTKNHIELNDPHKTLLIFVGASGRDLANQSTVTINRNTYNIINLGARYDNFTGIFDVEVIESNSNTDVTVDFQVSCYNYVSVIGID